MIKGLFETHIEVADLERSMKFYEEVLGISLLKYLPTIWTKQFYC